MAHIGFEFSAEWLYGIRPLQPLGTSRFGCRVQPHIATSRGAGSGHARGAKAFASASGRQRRRLTRKFAEAGKHRTRRLDAGTFINAALMDATANTSANLNRLQMLHFSFKAALYPLIAQKKSALKERFCLFHRHTFCEVTGLVHIGATRHRRVIGQ